MLRKGWGQVFRALGALPNRDALVPAWHPQSLYGVARATSRILTNEPGSRLRVLHEQAAQHRRPAGLAKTSCSSRPGILSSDRRWPMGDLYIVQRTLCPNKTRVRTL